MPYLGSVDWRRQGSADCSSFARLLSLQAAAARDVISRFVDTINGTIGANSILLIEDLPALLGLAVKTTGEALARVIDEHITSRGLILVATCTPSGYAQFESGRRTLSSCLEVINLGELSCEETLAILAAVKGMLETEHSVTISDEALEAASNLSGRVQGRSLPLRHSNCSTSPASPPNCIPMPQKSGDEIIGAEQVEEHLELRICEVGSENLSLIL
jgi:hypothetical protein